jgi:hypothetical protein
MADRWPPPLRKPATRRLNDFPHGAPDASASRAIGDDVAVSDILIDTLCAHGADATTVPHAMRYYVSARAEDLPELEMREGLVRAGVNADELSHALDLLERDAALLDSASLFILQDGFADEATRELADGAIGASRSKLPVVEAGLIANRGGVRHVARDDQRQALAPTCDPPGFGRVPRGDRNYGVVRTVRAPPSHRRAVRSRGRR